MIPFARPCFSDEDIREISARIEEILRSGWLTSGSFVQRFEKEFAEFIGTRHAVALNSGTAALHSVLLALGVKGGDEVIVPSNTFVATANVALYLGANPVFADSNLETFNISPHEIQRKISGKTKAVIIVHVAGNPCDMKEILEIAEDHNIPVVEDSAHAHGSKYEGVNCGTFGVAGGFSFYPTKIITTAEGGVVTTDDEALAEKIRIIRNHGRAAFGPSKIVEKGFNYRLSEVHAAIGLSQIKHIHEFVAHRNRLAEIYSREVAKIRGLKPQHVKNGNLCSYYTYIVRLTDEASISRDTLRGKLEARGIETSVLYYPIHLQPFYVRLFGYRRGELPVVEELGEKNFALPLYNGMGIEQAVQVVETLRAVSEEA